nr:AraC family transcriptional regulator [Paenibacillus sp. MSJ-34]
MAIDFIESRLMEPVTVEQIAKQAKMSPFHFQRTFAVMTGVTVGEYIRRRRLTLAAYELLRANIKIVDLAAKYGYDSPEAFAKAFRRQHGLPPSEAKARGTLVAYNRLTIQVNVGGTEPLNVRMVEREAFQAVGIWRKISLENGASEERIPALWDEVNASGLCDRLFQLNNGKLTGVLGIGITDPERDAGLMMDYWVAAEYVGPPPEDLKRIEVPSFRWAVFGVTGPLPYAFRRTWKQIYGEWFPSVGYTQAGPVELEFYPDHHPAAPDHYAEIWIPVM